VPWATFFNKGVSVGFERTDDRLYTTRLRDLVVAQVGHAAAGATIAQLQRRRDEFLADLMLLIDKHRGAWDGDA
jgi:hypothetical protein